MIYLFLASLLWSFSFGLIKSNLSGLDAAYVSMLRLSLSFIVFLPFLKIKKNKHKYYFLLILNGALQFGIMYIFYILSYSYLPSYQVALFTILTPFYVILISAILEKKPTSATIFSIILTVAGSLIMVWKTMPENILLRGFIILQIANISFAAGQVLYRKINLKSKIAPSEHFALLYLGAFLATMFFNLKNICQPAILNTNQLLSILYLGLIPSGLGFFLWNYGTLKVTPGRLAIMNNIKIPLAILISIIIFNEEAPLQQLLYGLPLILTAFYLENKDKNNK